MNNLLLVMTALILKHFFCDFPLQTVYMLGKGKGGLSWIAPLAAHAATHALFTALILLIYNPRMLPLALLDFTAHFIIDRIKATYRLDSGVWADKDRGKNLSKYYMAFGLDQTAHYLTYVLILYIIVNFS